MTARNPYDILGVDSGATAVELRAAYLKRVKVLHPDRFDKTAQSDEWHMANDMLKEVNEAHTQLRSSPQNGNGRSQPQSSPKVSPDSTQTTGETEIDRYFNMGNRYYNGDQVKQDRCQAFDCYLKAAKLGDALAQTKVGNMLLNGIGVSTDYGEALRWYRKAIEKGEAIAHHQLGFMYDHGWGVAQDYKQAVRWYRKAANLGAGTSFHNIGCLYEFGRGTTADVTKALDWYRRGAEKGDKLSIASLKRLATPQTKVDNHPPPVTASGKRSILNRTQGYWNEMCRLYTQAIKFHCTDLTKDTMDR